MNCASGTILANQIVMMENHNEAYYVWRKADVKERILVHLDAHLDLVAIPDKTPYKILESKSLKELGKLLNDNSGWNFSGRTEEELIHIGNFIYPALSDGSVREVWWVVPDIDWGRPKHRRVLKKILKSLPGTKSTEWTDITAEDNRLITHLYGKSLTVCNLDGLGNFSEDVLLDIDVDFMIMPSINLSPRQERKIEHKPWISPMALVDRLSSKKVNADLITISYSVEGGFTPLPYKYLGDALKTLLANPRSDKNLLEVIDFQWKADELRTKGLYDRAIELYKKALEVKPDIAPLWHSLGLCYWEKGDFESASSCYKKSLSLDSTYRTVFNNFGWKFKALGKWDEAEAEYEKIMSLDPGDSFAYTGIGDVYFYKKKFKEAEGVYRKSIELNPKYIPAHIGLARTYEQLKLNDDAIKEYETAVGLNNSLPFAYVRLGYLYAKAGRIDDAISSFKKTINLGFPSLRVFFSLGYLYLRKRMFFKAMEQYKKIIKILPGFFLLYLRRLWTKLVYRLTLCFH